MKKFLNLIVVLISVSTIISGLVQMIAPQFVLRMVGAAGSPAATHFFGIVGMFMVLFGTLMLWTVYSVKTSRAAVICCALQKFGAFAAVGLGVFNEIFANQALAVAIFDLFSAIIFFYYLRTKNANEIY